jgi:hypothetical protein
VSDIVDQDLLQRAEDGDLPATLAVLAAYRVPPKIRSNIEGRWNRGRQRDQAEYMNLVNARKHYQQRRWLNIPKAICIEELVDKFSLPRNVAGHLANGQGYSDVREEAQRQLTAETQSHFSSVGFPTP